MKSLLIAAVALACLLRVTMERANAQSSNGETSSQVPTQSIVAHPQMPEWVSACPANCADYLGDASRSQNASSPGKASREWAYFDVGGDVISPRSHQEYLTRAGGGSFALGFRPLRYLQTGLWGSFLGNFNGTPDSSATYTCTSGCSGTYTAAIKSHGNLLAIDSRVVLPLFRERLQISAGGGLAWLGISQSANTGNVNVPATCPPICGDARGHGPTEVIEIKYFPGGGRVGFGFHVRGMQVHSPGLNFDAAAAGGTYHDSFLLIGGQVSVRFGMH
jgi:hypothetical protein